MKTSLLICRVMAMFFVGTLLLRFIFSAVYFQQVGLSATYSGVLQGASRMANAIGGVVLGYAADRTDSRKAIFIISYLFYAVTPFLLTIPQPVNQCVGNGNISQGANVNQTEKNISSSRLLDVLKGNNSHGHNTSIVTRQSILAPHQARSVFNDNHNVNMKKDEYTNNKKYIVNIINQANRRKSKRDIHLDELTSTTTSVNTKNKLPQENDGDMKRLFVSLFVIIIVGDFLGGASINLIDTVFLGAVDDKKRYARIRLWGNIGQAVTIPLIAIITYFKTVQICGVSLSDYKFALYSTLIISGVGWFVAIFKVVFPSSKKDDDNKDNVEEVSVKEFLAPLETWSLLINAFFYGICNGSCATFLFWTMIKINPSQANLSVAASNFVRNLSALGTYFFVPKLLDSFGYRNILNVSCLVYAVGLTVIAFMRNSWIGILVEMLLSAAYALSVSACVSYIGEVAKPNLAVTAQGM